MKKISASAIALVILGTSDLAHAQSSVTMYGIVEYTLPFLGYIKTEEGNLWGNMAGGRWGLKGAEDLGGGLHTVFQMENGFNPGTGAMNSSSVLFNRQVCVGRVLRIKCRRCADTAPGGFASSLLKRGQCAPVHPLPLL